MKQQRDVAERIAVDRDRQFLGFDGYYYLDWIRILGKRIRKLDAKDRTKNKERVKIGEGDADWPAVRKALKEIGYRGWVAAEVRGGGRERLAEILNRMNKTLGKSDGRPGKNLPGATVVQKLLQGSTQQ